MKHATPGSRTHGLPFALALLFAGAFLRAPFILLHGRIWAEESNIFLVGVWHRSFLTELFSPEFGYYSLWDNLFAAVAAHPFTLPWAALLFTWSAVLLLLVTGWFLYQAEFLPTRLAKTFAVLALLFVAPSGETWLNLINSEFYFGICAAVILASDAARHRLARAGMLALAVLSGPLTVLLTPLFLLRALLSRRRGEIVQAAIVTAGALVQIGIALTTHTSNRKVRLNPLTLGPVLLNKQFVLLFLDRLVAKQTYLVLLDKLHFSTLSLVACWVLAITGIAALAWLLRRNRTALVVLGTAFWFALLESSLALNGGLLHVGPGGGERYAYTPNFLIVLALVTAAFTLTRPVAVRVLLALALLSGVIDYSLLATRNKAAWQGEPFRQQALRWQHDPTTELHCLPVTCTPFHLPPR